MGKTPSSGKKLTPKQSRFVEEYLIDNNATQAAIRAGYSAKTAVKIGSENISKPDVQAAIAAGRKEISERAQVSAVDVLREWAVIAMSDYRDFEKTDNGIAVRDGIDHANGRAISSVKMTTTTDKDGNKKETVEYRLWDKNRALENLAKHLGMFKYVAPPLPKSQFQVTLTIDNDAGYVDE